MTKLLAVMAALSILLINTIAYSWFVYGLWPKSWASVVLFGVIGVALSRALLEKVVKDE